MRKWIASLLFLLLLPVVFWGWAYANGWLNDDVEREGYAVFYSPDGRFRLVVQKHASFWPMVPGDSGGAPGYVVLKDRKGKELARADVGMVQRIDEDTIYWTEDTVDIAFVAKWPLPADSPSPSQPDSRVR
jgi:hypothetical protein